ncbi:MAG: cyanophycin synthetase, partial [Deltaproteobacteria bacterium]|nr:cyanophycin synthetase [Deltaproteobacteria bacterium]
MQVVERRTYLGPNLYALFPVIRLTVDLGPLEDFPSARIEGFVEGLLAKVPSLDQHTCSYGDAGGFVRRLTDHGEGTWLGHVLEHVAIELQNLCGIAVSFGKTRGTGEPGQYHVTYQYQDRWVGEEAGDLALRLLHALVPASLKPGVAPDPGFDFRAELENLILEATDRAFGPSTASLVRAAEERDIPWIRIGEGSLVQFGHGRYQRRIQATITSETRHIAVDVAGDKELTNNILGDLGLPVPKQFRARTPEKAVEAFERIGGPVVLKPIDGNHGRGVSIGLTTPEQVLVAFQVASEISSTVLIEEMIPGNDYRLLVVNGELVAAAQRVPGHVVGDGVSDVLGLIERVNADPRRGIGHEKVLTRLELDHQAIRLLTAAGLTPESVLEEGRIFPLRSTGNLSTGGTAIDVTDVIHPETRDMAIRAVKAIGLDVCGVDFLT